jgi:hypothetical protein
LRYKYSILREYDVPMLKLATNGEIYLKGFITCSMIYSQYQLFIEYVYVRLKSYN